MTQPRLYFQGFEGARKVQSMMIDFPELRFYLSSISRILALQIWVCPEDTEYMIEIWYYDENMNQQQKHINSSDTETKIFVAPEREGFFEPKDMDTVETDLNGRIGQYRKWSSGNVRFEFDGSYYTTFQVLRVIERNGKRIWMPQTDTDVVL